jgi:PAS domain S-box-containing protein
MAIIIVFYLNIKNYKKETRHLLDFQKLIFDNVPDIIFIKDDKFRIVQANEAFMSLYPKENRDKIIGFTTIEDYTPADAEIFLEQDKKALKTGFSHIIETIKFPDGQSRTLSTKKILFENNIKQKFILAVSNDITEQTLLQRETEKSQSVYRMIMDFFLRWFLSKTEIQK